MPRSPRITTEPTVATSGRSTTARRSRARKPSGAAPVVDQPTEALPAPATITAVGHSFSEACPGIGYQLAVEYHAAHPDADADGWPAAITAGVQP